MFIIEGTPFEKGASLKLPPENFRFYFFRIGRKQVIYALQYCKVRPI